MPVEQLSTRCCIVGGGPCGLMLGFLLARAGVDVVVLEKHADFLRDFRGDTIHPSTLELMSELGFFDDFLNLLADRGKAYPSFHLRTRAEAVDLIEDGGRVAGVRANTPDGPIEIKADLTVGCDGRHSTVRTRGGLKVEDLGAPMDVLWFRLA